MPRPSGSRWHLPISILLIVIVWASAVPAALVFFSKPVIQYRIQAGVLEIRGGESVIASHRDIPITCIADIADVQAGHGRRIAGTALPGLCTGRFSYPRLGPVWQVTDCSTHVLMLKVAGETQPILLSPTDPAAFADAIRAGRDADLSPPPRGQPASWQVFRYAVVLLMLTVAGSTTLMVVVAPRRLRYRLEGSTLVVQLAVLRRRFPLAGARARRYTPRSARKWAGCALPGHYTGYFSMDGTRTWLYTTSIKQEGVLIEGQRTVFITPAHIPPFLAALRHVGVAVEE